MQNNTTLLQRESTVNITAVVSIVKHVIVVLCWLDVSDNEFKIWWDELLCSSLPSDMVWWQQQINQPHHYIFEFIPRM